MKTPKTYSVIILIACTMLAAVLSQETYAAESSAIRAIQADIDADRSRIIEENKAIIADRRKLKEAEKTADKANIEQIKQDIEKREAAIRDLKKDINNKKRQKDDLIYGKTQAVPKRGRGG